MTATRYRGYDPNAVFDKQAWGRLKNNGALLLREMRDLTRPEAARPIHVAIVLGSDTESVPAVPLLEGGIRKKLLGYFDVVGFLSEQPDPESGLTRRLFKIRKDMVAEAKCRVHHFNRAFPSGTVPDPDFERLIRFYNERNINKETAE